MIKEIELSTASPQVLNRVFAPDCSRFRLLTSFSLEMFDPIKKAFTGKGCYERNTKITFRSVNNKTAKELLHEMA